MLKRLREERKRADRKEKSMSLDRVRRILNNEV